MQVQSPQLRSRPKVGLWVLWRVLWRSFFLQAVLNYKRMQNVGFGYCMVPALKKLYQGDALKSAMQRHLMFFNSHPYMTCALLGASVHLEEEVAAGLPAERVINFKRCMMGPMAAIGDSLFWTSIKPFCAAWAVAALFAGFTMAPIVFFLMYNAFHISLRTYGLIMGYVSGERVIEKLNRLGLTRISERCHTLAGVFLGATAALSAEYARRTSFDLGDGLEMVVIAIVALITLMGAKRNMRVASLIGIFSVATVVLIMLLNALYPIF